MSSTGVFRKVRRSMRKFRGLGLEVLLPLAGLAVGVLAGVLAWGALKSWVLDHRTEVDLRVGPLDRAEEAVRALEARVGDEQFQVQWLESARKEAGLAGSARLRTETVNVAQGEVRLVCLGRPRDAAVKALAEARDQLKDQRSSGIAVLMPAGHAERKAQAAGDLAVKQKALEKAKEQEQKLRAAVESDKDAAAAAARLEKARTDFDSLQKELAVAGAPRIEALQRELLVEKGRLLPSGGELPVITAAEELRLREELAQLARLLGDDARRDSTARHPVVRRLDEVAGRLKAADLAGKIEKNGKDLEKIKTLKSRQDTAKSAMAANEKIAARNNQAQKDLETSSNERAHAEAEYKSADEKFKERDAVRGVPVEVAVTGGMADELTRPWLVWPCLAGGLAAGAVLAVALRRYALARFSFVNDEAALADCLGVPVLGVVPTLAGLSPRQE